MSIDSGIGPESGSGHNLEKRDVRSGEWVTIDSPQVVTKRGTNAPATRGIFFPRSGGNCLVIQADSEGVRFVERTSDEPLTIGEDSLSTADTMGNRRLQVISQEGVISSLSTIQPLISGDSISDDPDTVRRVRLSTLSSDRVNIVRDSAGFAISKEGEHYAIDYVDGETRTVHHLPEDRTVDVAGVSFFRDGDDVILFSRPENPAASDFVQELTPLLTRTHSVIGGLDVDFVIEEEEQRILEQLMRDRQAALDSNPRAIELRDTIADVMSRHRGAGFNMMGGNLVQEDEAVDRITSDADGIIHVPPDVYQLWEQMQAIRRLTQRREGTSAEIINGSVRTLLGLPKQDQEA
jgi:hypothetical protein